MNFIINLQSGTVYKVYKNGPKTLPWGNPYGRSASVDKISFIFTLWVFPSKWEIDQFKIVESKPKPSLSQIIKILWSIVSKVAERSKTTIIDT